MLSPEDALHQLLKALPRCCNCTTAYATIIDMYRWPLCEKCWKAAPGSDTEPPSIDMREAVSAANLTLRISLSNSLAKIPSHHEIPPPPSDPPEAIELDLEEMKYRNKKLRAKIRRMREERIQIRRNTAISHFFVGFFFACLVWGLLHYL